MRMRYLIGLLVAGGLCLIAGCRQGSEAVDYPATPPPTDSAKSIEPVEAVEPVEPVEAVEAAVSAEQDESAVSAPLVSTGAALAPGDYTFAVRHDGRNRSYIVHVPELAAGPAPVVIALHGGGGTGADFQEQNGLDLVADREGFVAVYPEGTGVLPNRLHTWNSGDTCCGYALDRDVDDVGFLRAVISDLAGRVDIDQRRIYMTGHSNGAMMAYRFAVEASDLVTAIVPVGGAIDLADPTLTQAVALLHIHSLDDPRAIYGGGEGPPFPGTDRTVHHEPVLPGIAAWADASGCDADSKLTETVAGSGDNSGQGFERFAWSGCADEIAVEHLVLSGSGHGWPGVTAPRLVQRHLGPATTLVNASEEVWAFASQFSR